MFENFTFGAVAQSANSYEDSASPTDISFPPTIHQTSYFSQTDLSCEEIGGLNDIVSKFSQHSLRPDEDEMPQRSYIPSPTLEIDSSSDAEIEDEEITYMSAHRGLVTIPSISSRSLPSLPLPRSANGGLACRRLQRQLNVQFQSCNTHMRDISSLVEEMIDSSSQCRLHISPSYSRYGTPLLKDTLLKEVGSEELMLDSMDYRQRAISPDVGVPEDIDEGFVEMDTEDNIWGNGMEEGGLRRASTPSGIRKGGQILKWRGTGDIGVGGRAKVRCVPRMRRRKGVKV